ncbi:MAG: glycosyltransferase family A protein [Gammaproteobacteria bacterium]
MQFTELFYRLAASGLVPRRLFGPPLPAFAPFRPAGAQTQIEIVSHCWRYATLLTYQLSSLVLHYPRDVSVTMTVFYAEEDAATRRVLDFFTKQDVPNVRWNWWKLPKERLFRRSIGRNLAALASEADWVFFTDCDVLFRDDALDALGRAVLGTTAPLVFPREHLVTPLLPDDDPLFRIPDDTVVDVPVREWLPDVRDRATGPLQVTRGDAARAIGYCATTRYFQQPADRFQKAREDRVFRWLMGTQGTPIEVDGIYRIRHQVKGRKGAAIASPD